MYCKLFSGKVENLIIGEINQFVVEIVGNRLNDQEIESIVKSYKDRLLSEEGFSSSDFLFDLKEYVRLLDLEKSSADSFSPKIYIGADFLAMQKKLFSPKMAEIFMKRAELAVRQVIRNSLSEDICLAIIKAYQYRLLNEPNFNSEHFFLDLKGYIKYFLLEKDKFSTTSLEKVAKALSNNSLLSYKIWDESMEINLLHHYNFRPAFFCGSDEGKSIYLIAKKNIIVRFHFAFPSEFLYRKLMGTSQADLSKALGNDLFVVKTTNVPGEPMEIIEQFLPLTDFRKTMSDIFTALDEENLDDLKFYRNFIDKIDEKIRKNIVINQTIYKCYNNIGLVVRLDEQGTRRIYPVISDLDFNEREDSYDPQIIDKIRQQQANVQPDFLDYDDIATYFPAIRLLVKSSQ